LYLCGSRKTGGSNCLNAVRNGGFLEPFLSPSAVGRSAADGVADGSGVSNGDVFVSIINLYQPERQAKWQLHSRAEVRKQITSHT
jgi:hypothetical protein